MKSQYDRANVVLHDVREAEGRRYDSLLSGVLHQLDDKYPEAAKAQEDLSEQLERGFVIAANRGEKDVVQGFIAGVTYLKSRAAIVSYLASASRTTQARKGAPPPEFKQILLEKTADMLKKSYDIDALFVELYEPGRSSSTAQRELEAAERKLFLSLGFERMPVRAYEQPLGADPETDEDAAHGVHLHAFFTPGLTDAQKSVRALQFWEEFARSYDPDMTRPENTAHLGDWKNEMRDKTWAPSVTFKKLQTQPA